MLFESALITVHPLFVIWSIPMPVELCPEEGLMITWREVPFGKLAAMQYFTPPVICVKVSDKTFNNEFSAWGYTIFKYQHWEDESFRPRCFL